MKMDRQNGGRRANRVLKAAFAYQPGAHPAGREWCYIYVGVFMKGEVFGICQ